MDTAPHTSLASYQACQKKMVENWSVFSVLRSDRLRHEAIAERVAEGIAEDLLTLVLDWQKGDLEYQRDFADIILTNNLQRYLVLEVKKPGTLHPRRKLWTAALEQAWRYAQEQHITCIAVTDGHLFYAADIAAGGLRPRVFANLAAPQPQQRLWWVSVHGIYRQCDSCEPWDSPAPHDGPTEATTIVANSDLLHPKYKLPASCFAWVGDANKPSQWKLPYLHADGQVDQRRLPKAIQSLLSNYRGARVKDIPES